MDHIFLFQIESINEINQGRGDYGVLPYLIGIFFLALLIWRLRNKRKTSLNKSKKSENNNSTYKHFPYLIIVVYSVSSWMIAIIFIMIYLSNNDIISQSQLYLQFLIIISFPFFGGILYQFFFSIFLEEGQFRRRIYWKAFNVFSSIIILSILLIFPRSIKVLFRHLELKILDKAQNNFGVEEDSIIYFSLIPLGIALFSLFSLVKKLIFRDFKFYKKGKRALGYRFWGLYQFSNKADFEKAVDYLSKSLFFGASTECYELRAYAYRAMAELSNDSKLFKHALKDINLAIHNEFDRFKTEEQLSERCKIRIGLNQWQAVIDDIYQLFEFFPSLSITVNLITNNLA